MTVSNIQLTEREEEILRRLIEGATYAEIACAIGVGYETIKTNTNRLRAKLGLSRKSQLIAWAVRRQSQKGAA